MEAKNYHIQKTVTKGNTSEIMFLGDCAMTFTDARTSLRILFKSYTNLGNKTTYLDKNYKPTKNHTRKFQAVRDNGVAILEITRLY